MDAPRWPLARELRMPLQIGTTSLVEATIDSAIGMTIAALALVHAGDEGVLGWVVPLVGVLPLALIVWISWSALVGSRASDLVLGPAGLRVEGGPRHGLVLPWSAIDPQRCRVENDRVEDTGGELRGRQLLVGTVPRGDVLLAEVWQTDDTPALYVAIDEIRAVFGLAPLPEAERTSSTQADGAAPAPREVEQLRCRACGAALTPRDVASLDCDRCGEATKVPSAVRERLAAHAKLEHEQQGAQRILERILDQRGAGAANRWLALAMVLLFTAPLAVGALYAAVRATGGSIAFVLPLALSSAALVCMTTALTSPVFTRRVALRSCLVDLGARRIEGDDRPHCRACGGLLPAAKLLVRCVYCDCDNLLGLDLRLWARAVDEQRRSLAELLARRSDALRDSRFSLIVCLVVAAAAAAWPLVRVLDPS